MRSIHVTLLVNRGCGYGRDRSRPFRDLPSQQKQVFNRLCASLGVVEPSVFLPKTVCRGSVRIAHPPRPVAPLRRRASGAPSKTETHRFPLRSESIPGSKFARFRNERVRDTTGDWVYYSRKRGGGVRDRDDTFNNNFTSV